MVLANSFSRYGVAVFKSFSMLLPAPNGRMISIGLPAVWGCDQDGQGRQTNPAKVKHPKVRRVKT
jgi:hypothetical protein